MSQTPSAPEQRYLALVDAFSDATGVTYAQQKGFGDRTMKVNGKIFAMLVRGQLVVKLPKARVIALVLSGEGQAFDANKGKPMKEWFRLAEDSGLNWLALSQEALDFVRAKP